MAEPGAQEIGPLAKLLSAGQIADEATSVLGIKEGGQPGFRSCLCHPLWLPVPGLSAQVWLRRDMNPTDFLSSLIQALRLPESLAPGAVLGSGKPSLIELPAVSTHRLVVHL